jgi:DNA-binding GntR family transcriptional regulator
MISYMFVDQRTVGHPQTSWATPGETQRGVATVETRNRTIGQERGELDLEVLEGFERDGPIQTAHATVTKRLRDAVLSGAIRPGTRLVQSELARALRVSVTPVREALRDLAGEGLIDFDAFRGATVHTPSVDELHDIFDVRTHLIELSVRRGVSAITPAELAKARQLAKDMVEERDQFNWVELNREFHQIIEGAARSPQLSMILGRLSDISTPYVNLSFEFRPQQRLGAEDEHALLLDAYETGDVELAVRLSIEHLVATEEAAAKLLESVGP